MKNFCTIERIFGREILDSRGNPTVEVTVLLSDGTTGIGRAPSGASTGAYEALELRDNDPKRYFKKGVLKAVNNVNRVIDPLLCASSPFDIYAVDRKMLERDQSEGAEPLGANAILAVSIAVCRAAASSLGISFYKYIGGINAVTLPVPMMNILNGGAHASNSLDVQEFMIVPTGAQSFRDALRQCAEIYHCLGKILKSRNLSVSVGDEGGFAPDLESDTEAISLITDAIEAAGYRAGVDTLIAIDAAASEWRREKTSDYVLPKSGKRFTSSELIAYWTDLSEKYPIISIEDALGENDIDGWSALTSKLGKKIQLVGDDLFVTNTKRLSMGIDHGCGNSILIKPNQIGCISGTLDAVRMAHKAHYSAIASHRSGETEDTTIADLAVGLNTCQIKTGAPCRSERVAKYNRLLRIEEKLGASAVYPGISAFNVKR
jgi:enolase